MKIFTVIHNYGDPVPESLMGDGETDWYEMPDSAMLRTGNPFFVPDFDTRFLAFPSVCYRVGRLGKSVSARFAHRYVDSATAAVAVVAADLLKRLRASGLPWTRAVAFDRSFMLGNLQPIDTFINCGSLEVGCGDFRFEYDSAKLRLRVDRLIELISADNTIKNGDMILAGIPAEGFRLTPGQRLTIDSTNLNMNLIDINIR